MLSTSAWASDTRAVSPSAADTITVAPARPNSRGPDSSMAANASPGTTTTTGSTSIFVGHPCTGRTQCTATPRAAYGPGDAYLSSHNPDCVLGYSATRDRGAFTKRACCSDPSPSDASITAPNAHQDGSMYVTAAHWEGRNAAAGSRPRAHMHGVTGHWGSRVMPHMTLCTWQSWRMPMRPALC